MNQKGFTIIEILIVVAILGILAAVTIPQYQKFVYKSIRADAYITLNQVHKAQMALFSDTGKVFVDNIPPDGFKNTNEFLGLGFISQTNHGYRFWYQPGNILACDSNTNLCDGYFLQLLKDFDDDSPIVYEDKLNIHFNHTIYSAVCNDGVPWIQNDDITNSGGGCS